MLIYLVIPAHAGIHILRLPEFRVWIPALNQVGGRQFAGMTVRDFMRIIIY